MARETKVGLLLGLGVVFLFMCILQWRFGGRAHAELGAANTGSAVDVTRAGQGDPGTTCGTVLACAPGSAVAPEPAQTIADLQIGLRGRDEDAGLMTTTSDSGTVTPPVVTEHPETAGRTEPLPHRPAEILGDPVTPPVDQGTASYTVKPGDSFAKIAKAQGLKLQDIAKLNPGVDATKMKVGMKLVIPVKATETVQLRRATRASCRWAMCRRRSARRPTSWPRATASGRSARRCMEPARKPH